MNNTTTATATITVLVTGATGKTGRRVVERLRDHADVTVRLGSRKAEPAFDWTRPDGWSAVLAGVDAVYLSFQPDVAVPGSDTAIAEFCRQAVAAGVQRIVMLSGRGEPEAQVCEEVVRSSGLQYTILSSSWFMQNFSEDYLLDGVLAGELVVPVTEVPEPFVDAEDIADAAVAALTEDDHVGRTYELTGPRAITFAEAVAEIAAATGREIALVPIPLDDYVAALPGYGVPEEIATLLGYLFGTVLDGRNARPADGVYRVLARDAADFRDFASRTAATGAWKES